MERDSERAGYSSARLYEDDTQGVPTGHGGNNVLKRSGSHYLPGSWWSEWLLPVGTERTDGCVLPGNGVGTRYILNPTFWDVPILPRHGLVDNDPLEQCIPDEAETRHFLQYPPELDEPDYTYDDISGDIEGTTGSISSPMEIHQQCSDRL